MESTICPLRGATAGFCDSGFDEALANSVAHQVCGLVQIELVHNPGAMAIGGFHANAKAGGHLFCGIALCDERDHLPLAVGQLCCAPQGISNAVRFEHDLGYNVGDFRGKIRAPVRNLRDTSHEFIGRFGLEHVTADSKIESFPHTKIFEVPAQHDDLG